ncbi:hypothetical protein EUTSA_v10025304mg [Eutrema salsugineum]|uniref:Uncharacterized protein n=1 Tax=Eutrema salsugineum TaxID=72664 RepID=V4P6U9_EUTSA|nr:hypothetical protein EUTSA_v10025304mg [Eutrema salsugineum]
MPLPWKKSKSGRISRFVSDLQQSPKHGGSLVVETGFPTSLIDLFVKNRDRLKKSSAKRNNNNNKAQAQTASNHPHPQRRHVSSPPPPPLQRRRSLPLKLDPPSVTEDPAASKIEDSFVAGGGGGSTAEKRHDGDDDGAGNGSNRGGGGCVLMVVVLKVFVVAVLALSTKRLAVGITISAFALLFLELAVARVFTLLNLCPGAQVWLDSLIGKLIGKRRQEKSLEESSSTHERKKSVSFEIVESFEESKDCIEEIRAEEREVQTIRDVVFKKEKSKSAKLKSKIVKKIVPKKLRSYKKKKKMKIKEKEEGEEVELVEEEEGGEEEESVTEASSLFSEERIESEISERDDVGSNPPLLESCEEIIEEEEGEESESKGDLTKAMVLIVIVLTGLLSGKVFAIGLTLSWCLILRVVCCKSQTSL